MNSLITRLFFASTLSIVYFLDPVSIRAETLRVSVSSDGSQGNNHSGDPFINGDGRYVLFDSSATNLVANDSNGSADVFLRDILSQTTERVSIANNEIEAQGSSYASGISSDARYALFESSASNLLGAGVDTNNNSDLFMRDRTLETTSRVNLSWNGSQANNRPYDGRMSPDAAYVVFSSMATNLVQDDVNGIMDIFLRDRNLGLTELVTITDQGAQITRGSCRFPSLSNNGRIVAFVCSGTADELVSGDTNGKSDIFVRNRLGATTARVSVSSSGEEGDGDSSFPFISGDARYVAFQSYATNLVAGDTNARADIFVFDRRTNIIRRVSVNSNGEQANGDSIFPVMTSDGRYVTFYSLATNLVPGARKYVGNYNVYVHDTQKGVTSLVNTSSEGEEDNSVYDNEIMAPAISSTASHIAYSSQGSTLVNDDTNSFWDVFLTIDECLNDPAKIIPGICGCGVSDLDTDQDGIADCDDSCPDDLSKTSAGICGCSVPDIDSDGNGAVDCLDPSGTTIPSEPIVKVRKKKIAVVNMQVFPGSGISYRVSIKRGGRLVSVKRSRKDRSALRISGLASGVYRLKYEVIFRGMRSQESPMSARFRIVR